MTDITRWTLFAVDTIVLKLTEAIHAEFLYCADRS